MAISKVILNGETLMDVTSDTVESSKLLTGETATKNDGTKITGSYSMNLQPLTVKSKSEEQVFDGSPQTTEINGAVLEDFSMDSGDSNTLTSSLVWRDNEYDTSIVIGQKYHLSGWFGTGTTEETAQRIFFDTNWTASETLVSIPFTARPGYDDEHQDSFDGSIEFTEIKLSTTQITITATAPFVVFAGFGDGPITNNMYLSVLEIEGGCDGYTPVIVEPVTLVPIDINLPDTYENPRKYSADHLSIYKSETDVICTSASDWNSFDNPILEDCVIGNRYLFNFIIFESGGRYARGYSNNNPYKWDGTSFVVDIDDRSHARKIGTITIENTRFKIDLETISDGAIIRYFIISDYIDGFSSVNINNAARQSKTVSPSESAQTVTADSGYYGLSQVTVNAISSTYVGSAIPLKSAADVAINKAMGTIIAPSGYYSENTSVTAPKANMELTTSMNRYLGSVFWTYTNTSTGAVLARDIFTSSYQLPILSAQTITPGSQSQYINSYQWLTGSQTIAAIPSAYIIPSGTYSISSNGTYDIGAYKSVSVNCAGGKFYEIYRRLANKIVISSASNVSYASELSEWIDAKTIISYHEFAGQMFAGTFSFNNLTKLESGGFTWDGAGTNYGRDYSGSATIVLPKIQKLGTNTFTANKVISCVILPSCSQISDSAFMSCQYLTSIEAPICSSIRTLAFGYCTRLSSVSFPLISEIPMSGFEGAGLTEVNFPSVSIVDTYAFAYCKSLVSIKLPLCSNVGYSAFAYCSSLTIVSENDLPICTYVGGGAFTGCGSLTEVHLPLCRSLITGAFSGCNALMSVDLPKCSFVDSTAFAKCINLSSLYLPGLLFTITLNFLSMSSFLTTVSFPACSSIAENAFDKCSLLTTVDLSTCTFIGRYAFRSCIALHTLSIPLCSCISNSAFYFCSNLMSLYLTSVSSVPSITYDAAGLAYTPMSNSAYTGLFGSIYVPASLYDAFISAKYWSEYSSRIVSV